VIKDLLKDLKLAGLIDGEKTGDENNEEYLQFLRLKSALKELKREEVPADLVANIMGRVEKEDPSKGIMGILFKKRVIHFRVSIASVVTAVVFLVLAGVIFSFFIKNKTGFIEKHETQILQKSRILSKFEDTASRINKENEAKQIDQIKEYQKKIKIEIALESAKSVKIIGDFDGWSGKGIEMSDNDGDGIWTAEIVVEPGKYRYIVLVNEKERFIDEGADLIVEDEFGGLNSVRFVL